jgi:hypothetical protein
VPSRFGFRRQKFDPFPEAVRQFPALHIRVLGWFGLGQRVSWARLSRHSQFGDWALVYLAFSTRYSLACIAPSMLTP